MIQTIEFSVFSVEQVYQQITEIQQDPCAAAVTFRMVQFDTFFVQFLFYFVCHSMQLVCVFAAGNHETVCDIGQALQIQNLDIFAQFIFNSCLCNLCRFQCVHSKIPPCKLQIFIIFQRFQRQGMQQSAACLYISNGVFQNIFHCVIVRNDSDSGNADTFF